MARAIASGGSANLSRAPWSCALTSGFVTPSAKFVRRPDGLVFAAECKRLKAARNATQIVNRLKEFRGEIGDDLDRHLTRFRWLSDNLPSVARVIGYRSPKICLKPLLITNTTVPMQYMTGLPIPNSSIGPVTSLEQLIAANVV